MIGLNWTFSVEAALRLVHDCKGMRCLMVEVFECEVEVEVEFGFGVEGWSEEGLIYGFPFRLILKVTGSGFLSELIVASLLLTDNHKHILIWTLQYR